MRRVIAAARGLVVPRSIPALADEVRRRSLFLGIGAALALPLAAGAQQKPMPVIGVLSTGPPLAGAPGIAAFRQGLSETGYVEGQNVAIEYRGAEGRYDRLPALAGDLVARRADVIVTLSGAPDSQAAKAATSTIPIVFFTGSDPVADGLVTSLARPGGNVTGFTALTAELTAKRLDLLSELVPQSRIIALLVNPNAPNAERVIGDVQQAAQVKGMQLFTLKARTEDELEVAFASAVQIQVRALVIAADPFLFGRREQIVALAARHAVPAMYFVRNFVNLGGLISYGASPNPGLRQVGIYAGRILKGEKPADLPVQQPTKFELVINMKTAKALGLSVPQSLLLRADEVIE